ncbi:exodeoxyribonuclease V subunit gamma [Marilutibacter alkalisoli]|uniref:RecBCD enzyme subunit RecC n=1 Tax=Marilutibacter alkalisoli TaxID=2591633 RepID=A0A514BP19_9GAMM|nr:exodeoxyribonuclease V subunit gamma [Lysobacter alkalisoli]QDH68759.1 exodeoxyribonuclease V subunit gamma [Lysobacter alkalisoli]
MPGPSDFRLYHSNALDVLAGLLADALREPAPGQALLTPDTILIPQVAMRRWLQATLAARHGVAANLEFLTPGEFVARALDANLGRSDGDLDAAALQWRVYAALADPAVLERPALRALREHLRGDDALKPWALAGELAAVFEKYQAWRRDWLLRWEAGADPDDPQAILWREVAAGRTHRARRIQDYLARFGRHDPDGEALPQGLPPRLFAFATLNVSPDVLRVMATQARVGTLHFYLPTPTRAYWGDLQALGARLRSGSPAPFGDEADENPLLRSWGMAGRDFMALLGSYEVVHPSGEIDACVDPEHADQHDSLLQRLQADLFHRRSAPSGTPRAAVDRDDPSLQLHACHTRLRELQVLHDRLRALLEDKRFDPPLQPREIAVLAPDIDPYVPYLDAVFGGHGDKDHAPGGPIPYAMADASPLAGEPLAEVFLRLLALPVARFGLQEMLDLLASPPLAEAAGLDADAFERLHGWLQAAGARWGIDAAHRARHGAPADDAYTWQFALDRLLLGHATGGDEPIAGAGQVVAPWPELEGGALEALDKLLRLLRVLARHQRLLGEAMPPAQWRERLLVLLDDLPPRPPSTPGGQRALERLRRLVDSFARDAERAGAELPVPAEVVRSHFAAVLSAADTRAPLLTGGVSFARMVPMRLLPFRVICLLGMNDGEFPRRDPVAGLNRLTAELDTGKRRHGDRSTRDDDRYLFLQLFSSAQDVFYLSWLGADPRDGSVREPSALVDELRAAAGAYHADPAAAAQELVLRHPLQPFSPAAFGGGDAPDPRHFSYRRHWHPAAGHLAGARTALPPWMDAAAALAPAIEVEDTLSLDALRRFLMAPAEQFLRQRLGLRLAEVEAAGEDVEPLQAPGRGLERMQLQRAAFDALLAGEDAEAMQPRLRARGLLPSGPLGRRALAGVLDEVQPYAAQFVAWRGDAEPRSWPLEVEIDGVRLQGRLADAWPQGLARLRFGTPNGPSAIRHGLDWLLAEAAGLGLPLLEFHQGEDGVRAYPRDAIGRDQATAALRHLLALRGEGLRRPLAFAPYSGWEYFNAPDPVRAVRNAAAKWRGGTRQWAEGDSEALRLALRGRDPFTDLDTLREFAALARAIYGAVTRGVVEGDAADVLALPLEDDAEDAA